jgi:hypothetical protein
VNELDAMALAPQEEKSVCVFRRIRAPENMIISIQFKLF